LHSGSGHQDYVILSFKKRLLSNLLDVRPVSDIDKEDATSLALKPIRHAVDAEVNSIQLLPTCRRLQRSYAFVDGVNSWPFLKFVTTPVFG
jgi:hypothetical protein